MARTVAMVSMFGNEGPIAPAFGAQLRELFDFGLFTAHNSNDQTHAIISDMGGEVSLLEDSGHEQSRAITLMAQEAFSRGADFVFPLDFDEFLPFDSRSTFDEWLSALPTASAYSMHWRCLFSADLGSPLWGRNWYFAHAKSSVKKVFLSKQLPSGPEGFVVLQGNHGIRTGDEHRIFETDLPLLHIPVHGVWHFAQKVIRGGVVAIEQQMRDGDTAGNHWLRMQADPFPSLSKLELTALDYGERINCEGHPALEQSPLPAYLEGATYPEEALSALQTLRNYWSSSRDALSDSNTSLSVTSFVAISNEVRDISSELARHLELRSGRLLRLFLRSVRAWAQLSLLRKKSRVMERDPSKTRR